MVDQEQRALTISEVAVDWQEPMVLQYKCGHPLPALTNIGPAVAASKHTTAPINHTRPSPRKHSPDVTTPSEMAEPDYCLLLIYQSRKDKRLSWPSWLTCSGWLTHQLQVELGRRLSSGILIHPAVWPQRTWPKIGGLCPFWGGAGSPSNTMWPGPRPTSTPSLILIHLTVWPQYTNVTDRTGQTDIQTDRTTV